MVQFRIFKGEEDLQYSLDDLKNSPCLLLADFKNISLPDSPIYLDDAELKRLKNISIPAKADHFKKSRWFLKKNLASLLSIPVDAISFDLVGEGRPVLKRNLGKIDFNISHTEEYLLAGFGLNCSVGVDIEKFRERTNWLAVGEKVFTRNEMNSLRTLELKCFSQLWSLKEALLKAHAGGVFKNAKQLEFEWEGNWVLKKTPKNFQAPNAIRTYSQYWESFALATCYFSINRAI